MESTAPVAFITGAAKRIGATIAKQLHQQGYNVLIHYSASEHEAQALSLELNTQRAQSAHTLQANLCDMGDIDTLATAAMKVWGKVDVLVNNASSFYPTPVGSIEEKDWYSLVGSNLKGPLFLSQALAPALIKSRGCIINMVDMHIDRPLPKHTVYLLAKTGLASLTQSLAVELAPHVRVNAIAPGAILWPERAMNEKDKQTLIDSIPLGALGSPDDIAQALLFLVSASYVTGNTIYVDGGRRLHSNASA